MPRPQPGGVSEMPSRSCAAAARPPTWDGLLLQCRRSGRRVVQPRSQRAIPGPPDRAAGNSGGRPAKGAVPLGRPGRIPPRAGARATASPISGGDEPARAMARAACAAPRFGLSLEYGHRNGRTVGDIQNFVFARRTAFSGTSYSVSRVRAQRGHAARDTRGRYRERCTVSALSALCVKSASHSNTGAGTAEPSALFKILFAG